MFSFICILALMSRAIANDDQLPDYIVQMTNPDLIDRLTDVATNRLFAYTDAFAAYAEGRLYNFTSNNRSWCVKFISNKVVDNDDESFGDESATRFASLLKPGTAPFITPSRFGVMSEKTDAERRTSFEHYLPIVMPALDENKFTALKDTSFVMTDRIAGAFMHGLLFSASMKEEVRVVDNWIWLNDEQYPVPIKWISAFPLDMKFEAIHRRRQFVVTQEKLDKMTIEKNVWSALVLDKIDDIVWGDGPSQLFTQSIRFLEAFKALPLFDPEQQSETKAFFSFNNRMEKFKDGLKKRIPTEEECHEKYAGIKARLMTYLPLMKDALSFTRQDQIHLFKRIGLHDQSYLSGTPIEFDASFDVKAALKRRIDQVNAEVKTLQVSNAEKVSELTAMKADLGVKENELAQKAAMINEMNVEKVTRVDEIQKVKLDLDAADAASVVSSEAVATMKRHFFNCNASNVVLINANTELQIKLNETTGKYDAAVRKQSLLMTENEALRNASVAANEELLLLKQRNVNLAKRISDLEEAAKVKEPLSFGSVLETVLIIFLIIASIALILGGFYCWTRSRKNLAETSWFTNSAKSVKELI